MLTAHPHPTVRWLHTHWNTQRPLVLAAGLAATLGVFFLAGILLDPRYVTGAPVWLKPLKFSVSVTVYALTLAWMLGFVEGRARLVNALAWITSAMLSLEWVALVTQAARGVASHFNYVTPFDTFMFIAFMAVPIVVLWIANAAVAVLLLLQRFDEPVLAWSLRLGLLITLLGMAEGFLMTAPTSTQLSALQGGHSLSFLGAHTVGSPDGGPGLPGLGWSTSHGDLRVGHFVGMHALQVLPLLAAVLMRRSLSRARQLVLLFGGAAFYLGVTVLVTWQALRGEPITRPGSLTLVVFAALVVATLVPVLVTAVRPRRSEAARTLP